MTTTLSAKGQIVIPQRVRADHKLKPGTDFTATQPWPTIFWPFPGWISSLNEQNPES